ncbi:hypothetical protein C8Q76DRAFT_693680 [Earliella scabrosa]|nr:hypothetical protein C8Q76DRAFT_693680 [Earliella scabrosa]
MAERLDLMIEIVCLHRVAKIHRETTKTSSPLQAARIAEGLGSAWPLSNRVSWTVGERTDVKHTWRHEGVWVVLHREHAVSGGRRQRLFGHAEAIDCANEARVERCGEKALTIIREKPSVDIRGVAMTGPAVSDVEGANPVAYDDEEGMPLCEGGVSVYTAGGIVPVLLYGGEDVTPMLPYCGPDVAPMLPYCDAEVAPMLPYCDAEVAPMLPYCDEEGALMLPYCDAEVAPMTPYCSEDALMFLYCEEEVAVILPYCGEDAPTFPYCEEEVAPMLPYCGPDVAPTAPYCAEEVGPVFPYSDEEPEPVVPYSGDPLAPMVPYGDDDVALEAPPYKGIDPVGQFP